MHRSHVSILNHEGTLGFFWTKSLPPLTSWSRFAAVVSSLDTAIRFEVSSHYMNYPRAAIHHGWGHDQLEIVTSCCDFASSFPKMHSSSPCTSSSHRLILSLVRNSQLTIYPVSQYTTHIFLSNLYTYTLNLLFQFTCISLVSTCRHKCALREASNPLF